MAATASTPAASAPPATCAPTTSLLVSEHVRLAGWHCPLGSGAGRRAMLWAVANMCTRPPDNTAMLRLLPQAGSAARSRRPG